MKLPAFVLAALLLAQADDYAEFAKLSRDGDPGKRCNAIDAIKGRKDLKMVQALFTLFGDPHPRVRTRAMLAAKGVAKDVKDDAAAWLADTGLKAKSGVARQMIVEALGWLKVAATEEAVRGRLADAEADVRAQSCDALAWMKAKGSLDAILKAAVEDKDGFVRAAALDAAVRIDAPAADDAAAKAAADKHYAPRLNAALLSPDIGSSTALAVMEPLVRDDDWRVRSAAIEGVLKLRERPAVGWLIARFAVETGRLRWDLLSAIMDLTGKDLGPEPKPWVTWWEANKDTFEPVKKGKDGKAVAPPGATKAEFFEVPIVSNRIVFVLDLSGSMRDPAPGKAGTTKLDAAKDGMIRTVKSLDPEVRFGILGLGSDDDGKYLLKEQKTWRKQLKLWPAAPAMKSDAEKYLKALEAKGWTNLWDGIEYAFADPDVDTIYLYTDGGASRGVWVASGEILFQLKRMNRYRRIVIHTIEVPGTTDNAPDNVELLKDIASATGGVYQLASGK